MRSCEDNPGIDACEAARRGLPARLVRAHRREVRRRATAPASCRWRSSTQTVEHTLLDPTFVHAYPAEVSPLSRANDADPFLTDRFEFFLAGRELANGFSELNDPEDQAARFRAQVERKDAGDEEAMYYDADYIRALEYGMPPTAGLGIGVDRLVMFLTDQAAIRDVLLFPQVRPERLKALVTATCPSACSIPASAGSPCSRRCARACRRKISSTSATRRGCPTAPRPRRTVERYALQAVAALVAARREGGGRRLQHRFRGGIARTGCGASRAARHRRRRAGRRRGRGRSESQRAHRGARHRGHGARRRLPARDRGSASPTRR